jgi:uncharacterized membrane protein YcaP (DUF421 family)
LRAFALYLVLLVLLRLTGKRSLSQVTTFDFVILLIVGEASQQALLGEDFSVIHAALVIATLLLLDRGSDYLAWRFGWFQRWTQSVPAILVENGRPLNDVLKKFHLTEDGAGKFGRHQRKSSPRRAVLWQLIRERPSGGAPLLAARPPRSGRRG